MEYFVYGWLGALVLFIIIEIVTVNLTTIWFAAGSLVALVLSVFKAPVPAQIAAFLIISLVMLIFARPSLSKAIKKDEIKTNVDSVIGTKAKVIETINNNEGTGAVIVNGQEWTARATEYNRIIEVGELVEIETVSGVKLMVK